MSDVTNVHPPIATCWFGNSERIYDYVAPFPVSPGDRCVVETRNGEAIVEVVGVKEESDRATKPLLRLAEPKQDEEIPS